MLQRLALSLVFLSVLAIGGAYASAFAPGGAAGWAAWAMAGGTAVLMVSVTMLGAARHGRLGQLWVPLALVLVVVAGGFGVVLSMPPVDAAGAGLWLGLPPRAAIVLLGVGLLPLLGVPLAYALTFDEMTLTPADLERLRAAREARSRAAVPDDPGSGVAEGLDP